jgi:hypothetical protein
MADGGRLGDRARNQLLMAAERVLSTSVVFVGRNCVKRRRPAADVVPKTPCYRAGDRFAAPLHDIGTMTT